MPGANYMGGKRNAAKARVKDTTGRLEKSFFGQRRLCAASQAMGRNKIPLGESLGGVNISLGHAKRKIPDVITSSFIPSPIDVSPSTPRSRRRTQKRLEAHSSISNVGRSKVLDALDVSEPVFLRRVLNGILTMPDLAGISRNQTKPTVGIERQPQASDESSPLQRTKKKRLASDLYEGSDSLSDDYNMESTEIEIHDDGFADDVQGDLRSNTSSSRDFRSESCRYSTSPRRPSSNHTPYSKEITSWKESHTRLPTSIVFRGFSAKRSMTTATYPFEEPTVYGTLFEQADPWDTIGQILGLSNTKSPGEVTNELSDIDRSFEASSAVVETEERQEDLMSADDIPELQYSPLMGRQLIASPCQKLDGPENAGTALEVSQAAGLSEDEQLFVGKEHESVLVIPELEESDGLFLGPSLFELDKDEDEIY